jgi:DNA polymerase-3 subunit beta
VLSQRTVNELAHTLDDHGLGTIQVNDNTITFQAAPFSLTSTFLHGTFPKYEQVIPEKSRHIAQLARLPFRHAILRATVIATSRHAAIRLIFKPGNIEIIAKNHELGESKESFPITYDGPDLTIAVNPYYLIEPLTLLEEDTLTFIFNDSRSPLAIRTTESIAYVLMPIQINGAP